MLNGRKVIGICLTKIQDTTRSHYVECLYKYACERGWKLIVFNSFLDFYNNDAMDVGAKSVYDLMNYDVLDAVIVMYNSFYDKKIADDIIADIKAHDVPVILLNGEADGCISLCTDYRETYKALLRHVINEHGVTDTFFIAGKRENDPDSVIRINCYKEVLEENGIPFEEDRVDYGEYWNEPAEDIIKRLTDNGRKPPRAIFCANDYMAFAVCDILKSRGYSVPKDVIVTGFDGVPAAEHYSPQLTTCKEDIDGLAVLSIEAANMAFGGEKNFKLTGSYATLLSESCGCTKFMVDDFRQYAADAFHSMEEMEAHEDYMYTWIDTTPKIKDINGLYDILSGCILEGSYVCLKSDFVSFITDSSREKLGKDFSDRFLVISSIHSPEDIKNTGTMTLADMVPNVKSWENDDSLYILNSVYVGDEVCGFYAVKTDDIGSGKRKMKRVLKTVNVAFNIALNYFKKNKLRAEMENAAYTNNITGLPNLKGAVKWFDEFSKNEKYHENFVSVSVYGLPKYTYIYENYGIEAAEDALRFVADALKISNPADCFLGHIADDEFIVVNYYRDGNGIGEIIDKATSAFFSLIENYNNKSGKEYFVEVNCGCTVVDPGWDVSLENFIKYANNEMYMNRLKMGTGPATKQQETPKDHYKAFDLLVKKNLFHYYFQPIVSAKNGEIYAYEALMRTDSSIGMNPLEVLDTAKEYNRLYDIEKATMFNIIERFAAERDTFGNAKVFINTIPGYFLKDSDLKKLTSKYKDYMDSFVFELTEQDTVSDTELNSIRRLSSSEHSKIAIDDYGTGHSNIVNLMRYAPQIIKIDRFLISDIHKNQNKQMFVRSTIEFARLNKIKVLAEGVETSNELRMVIDLGVDLIQGFYTGKPAPDPVPMIADEIRQEILEANPLLHQETV